MSLKISLFMVCPSRLGKTEPRLFDGYEVLLLFALVLHARLEAICHCHNVLFDQTSCNFNALVNNDGLSTLCSSTTSLLFKLTQKKLAL